MTNSKIIKLQKYLDKLITHSNLNSEFTNIHMVGWICENLFEKHVPKNIQSELKNKSDIESAINLFLNNETASPDLISKHQHLYDHIQHQKSFYMENQVDKFYYTADEFMNELSKFNVANENGLTFNIREFMKVKKNHEVEIASKVIGILAKTRVKDHLIVDVGDGHGYLSSRVALEYKFKTLGIEANPNNSLEAEIRNERLTKLWNHLVTKEAKRINIDPPEIESNDESNKNYRTISAFVYGDTDLNEIIASAYRNEKIVNDICLISLHGCGNLSSTVLKQFVENDNIKIVFNVPCCYNLLYEEFCIDYFNNEERIGRANDFGFPLSNFLRDKKFSIGRNARMLATQSYDKILAGKSQPDESLFYRAIFEKLLRERFRKGLDVHVYRLGKIKKVKNLEDYLIKACKKLNLCYDLTSDELSQLENDYAVDKELMKLHYYIRLLHSKIIESIIHLDRYLYLLENDIKHVYLVKIFDDVISPRSHALIGIKE